MSPELKSFYKYGLVITLVTESLMKDAKGEGLIQERNSKLKSHKCTTFGDIIALLFYIYRYTVYIFITIILLKYSYPLYKLSF